MTPLMQRGFDDAKAGGIDPILGTADTAEAKEYRDGHRQARRDAFDGIELEGENISAPVILVSTDLGPTTPTVAIMSKFEPAEPQKFTVHFVPAEEPPEPKKRKPKPAPADEAQSTFL